MLYQPGDRVVVREDLRAQRYYMDDRSAHDSAVAGMIGRAGQIVTIDQGSGKKYKIKEDGGNFWWVDDMFSGLAFEAIDDSIELPPLSALLGGGFQ